MLKSGAALKQEMSRGGPEVAISVCKDTAPEIAGRLSRETGWRINRVGTRVRNPLLGMPDVWEQQVLERFSTRGAASAPLADMDYSELVDEPNGRYFRYMRAIEIKPVCLACHGPQSSMPGPVHSSLAQNYPADKAVGYGIGDLRGAISIKAPIARE